MLCDGFTPIVMPLISMSSGDESGEESSSGSSSAATSSDDDAASSSSSSESSLSHAALLRAAKRRAQTFKARVASLRARISKKVVRKAAGQVLPAPPHRAVIMG